jgi:membrane-associated phospholipid phosphatase
MDTSQLFTLKSIGYGLLAWLIPFAAGFVTFPVKQKRPLVFKTLMAVVLVFVTVGLSRSYLMQAPGTDATTGLLLGVLWAVICLVIDLPLFTLGFKMSPGAYLSEIGMSYLIIPAITWGNASLLGIK